MVILYALGNRETGLHFSPVVWRVILALMHKKIEFQLEILSLEEIGPKISEITGGNWQKVPLIQYDDGTYNYESFDIAVELEKRYPKEPQLFPIGISNAKFYDAYFMGQARTIHRRLVFPMHHCYTKEGQIYFRKSREAMFGCTLEEFVGDADNLLRSADTIFDPLRAALKSAPFVEGDQRKLYSATFSDYLFFGGLQWIKVTAPEDFDYFVNNQRDDILKKWYYLISHRFNDYPANAKTLRDVSK